MYDCVYKCIMLGGKWQWWYDVAREATTLLFLSGIVTSEIKNM